MKVFISHTATDAHLAQRLAKMLRSSGFQVWDYDQIMPGDNWAASLGKALDESEAMVVLLTPSAVKSQQISSEISYALGHKTYKNRLIPVIAAPENQLNLDDIPWVFHLQQFQTIRIPHLDQDEAGLQQITQALKAITYA